MIFLIILLAINVANFAQATVKPLPTLATVSSSVSTTTDNQASKTKTRVNDATPNPVKLSATKNGRDLFDHDDYEKLEQLFENSNEPRQGGPKLTNKELVDNIFQLILDNKHVDVDCDSYHCFGNNLQNYKKRFQKYKGFADNLDYSRFGDHFGHNNEYEGYNKQMYPMKLPLNSLALETPKDGVLGKFHFRFVPFENTRRRHGRW